jgi:hypothetical protein
MLYVEAKDRVEEIAKRLTAQRSPSDRWQPGPGAVSDEGGSHRAVGACVA